MIALISDIHANLEAFEAVLEDISTQGVDKTYCLGDVIGYGPDPEACLRLAMDCDLNLQGNHEAAVLTSAFGFHSLAKQAIDWTRQQLKPGLLNLSRRKLWRHLASMPQEHQEGDALYVHASPREPVTEYLLEELCAGAKLGTSDTLDENFTLIKRLCFVGHTHKPGIMTESYEFLHIEDFHYQFDIPDEGKFIVNIGSVGQPRDNDNRACYVLYDPANATLTFRRVPYDFQTTTQKVKSIPDLDDKLGERLRDGI